MNFHYLKLPQGGGKGSQWRYPSNRWPPWIWRRKQLPSVCKHQSTTGTFVIHKRMLWSSIGNGSTAPVQISPFQGTTPNNQEIRWWWIILICFQWAFVFCTILSVAMETQSSQLYTSYRVRSFCQCCPRRNFDGGGRGRRGGEGLRTLIDIREFLY